MVVVAAVDDRRSESAIVEQGRKIAGAFSEPLHVVHVLDRSRFQELERTSVDETGRTIEVETIRKMAKEIAEEVASETVASDYTAVGLVGNPPEEVLKYVSGEDASYLVIGGRKRSKVGKALFGSVTQSILLSAELSVLTVMNDE